MRWIQLLLAACCVAALIAACGGATSTTHHSDAGADTGGASGSTGSGSHCTDSSECPTGKFCINTYCGTCDGSRPPALQCTGNTFCSQVTHNCEQRAGGSSGSSGSGSTGGSGGSSGTTGAGGPCTHRSDCPGAEACLSGADGGYCENVDVDGGCAGNDDCEKQYVCQAHACVYGCFNNLDCHGTDRPVCIAGNPGHCGLCTSNNQCLSSENCEGGQCVPKAACTSADTCGGLGCVGGFCGPCTANGDCSSNNVCDISSGHCVAPPSGCSSDAQCQSQHSGSSLWYCDSTNVPDGGVPSCKPGCLPDDQCSTPQAGCCDVASGQTCDTTAHACVAGTSTTGTGTTTSGTTTGATTGTTSSTGTTGSCDTTQCADACAQTGQQCDVTTCTCTGTTGSTTSGTTGGTGSSSCPPAGDMGQPCNDDCSCNSGLSCIDFASFSTRDPNNPSDRQYCAVAACFATVCD